VFSGLGGLNLIERQTGATAGGASCWARSRPRLV